jgi:hypothetical protein
MREKTHDDKTRFFSLASPPRCLVVVVVILQIVRCANRNIAMNESSLAVNAKQRCTNWTECSDRNARIAIAGNALALSAQLRLRLRLNVALIRHSVLSDR